MTKPPPRDWDKELADIDKIIARQPAGPAPGPLPAGSPSPRAGELGRHRPIEPPRHRVVLTAWLRVVLALGVAAAMTQWPYAHGCGFQLYLYLGAAGVVFLAGLWGAVTTWRRRMAFAHLLSLLVVLWGGCLAGKAVLDRTDYVKTRLTWTC
jgi:hypothetical protein